MKSWTAVIAAFAAVLVFSSGAALAKDKQAKKAGCDSPSASVATNAPAKVEGEITKIDQANQMITVRGADGATHEFHANPSDLKSFKVGDKLEAKRRDC